MSTIDVLFGEVRSLIAEHEAGEPTWSALVAFLDERPIEELEAFLPVFEEYWFEHVKTWDDAQKRIDAPEHWMESWLAGSPLHALLLDLVPRPTPNANRSPLTWATYYKVTFTEVEVLSNNGDSCWWENTAFYNDPQPARRVLFSDAEDYDRALEEYGEYRLENMLGLPYDISHLRIVWRGKEMSYMRSSNYLDSSLRGDVEYVESKIPSLGKRDLLPDSFPDKRTQRFVAYQGHYIPREIWEEAIEQSMLGPYNCLKSPDSGVWDGQIHTGRFYPLDVLKSVSYADYIDIPSSFNAPLPAGDVQRYERAVRQVCEEFGIVPTNALPEVDSADELADLFGTPNPSDVLPEAESWDEVDDKLYEGPWLPEVSLKGYQSFLAPVLPLEKPLETRHTCSSLGEGTISLSLIVSHKGDRLTVGNKDEVTGMAYGLEAAVAERLTRILRTMDEEARTQNDV